MFNLEYEVLLYKAVIDPIWIYGIKLWGSAEISNIEFSQCAPFRILRTITGAHWFVKKTPASLRSSDTHSLTQQSLKNHMHYSIIKTNHKSRAMGKDKPRIEKA